MAMLKFDFEKKAEVLKAESRLSAKSRSSERTCWVQGTDRSHMWLESSIQARELRLQRAGEIMRATTHAKELGT